MCVILVDEGPISVLVKPVLDELLVMVDFIGLIKRGDFVVCLGNLGFGLVLSISDQVDLKSD